MATLCAQAYLLTTPLASRKSYAVAYIIIAVRPLCQSVPVAG